MKKEWLVKTLALGIVVLFVCISVVPSSGITTKNSVSLDPYIPSNPFPYDGETDVPIDGVVLYWYDCNIWKDVYFGESNPPPLVAENLWQTCYYDPGLMDANTTYYWKVVAKNGGGATYPGPIWNFTTGSRINHPPNPPEITVEKLGGGKGEGYYWIFIKLTDPDGDNLIDGIIVHDRFDFGWPIHDPYTGPPPWANGTVLQESRPYYYGRGWHEIKVICWDSWVDSTGYLDFTIPRNRVQSIQQSLRNLFSQQIDQLLQNLLLHYHLRGR
jgi:hypothetical protein